MSRHATTETHFYDGKWIERTQPLRSLLARVHRNIPVQQKLSDLQLFRDRLASALNDNNGKHVALKYYDMIVKALPNEGNYDPTNDVHADDLLYLIAEYCRKNRYPREILLELALQLYDMRTGSCVQGRSTRLFQVYAASTDMF